MHGTLVLQDGTRWVGEAFGAPGTVMGELVFNTGMTGYQEILTDPSYAGQVVVLTYPLIGNYGINPDHIESSRIQVRGLIVKELAPVESHWKSMETLSQYLGRHGVFGLAGVDTRMITRRIRTEGAPHCLLTTDPVTETKMQALCSFQFPKDVVSSVSCKKPFSLPAEGPTIGVIDLGAKQGILRNLQALGANLKVYPWDTPAKTLLSENLDAVLFSNGPGDPKDVTLAIQTAKDLVGQIPVFGICLGHQILALALGGDTYKLKFGHRGSNHPVQDLRTGKVMITAQNHGYAVREATLPDTVEVTHVHVNDGTNAGFAAPTLRLAAVQFHPEAGPGPRDANAIFKEWLESLKEPAYA